MEDRVHMGRVDDTRAKALLAEGRINEAEKLARSAVQTLERGGEQSLLAEALTTHGVVLARMGNYRVARLTLQRAVEVGQNVGDLEAAGLAALTVLEELGDHLPAQDRLLVASRRVLFLIGLLPTPPTWKGFNLYDAVNRYEAHIIERALREAGGVVSRAAELLGLSRQGLDSMLKGRGRHTALADLRAPAEHHASSLMFRGDDERPETRPVVVLHVEDNALVADAVNMVLQAEGWSVETCAEGTAALARLASGERFDALIVANRIPGANGIELIQQTRTLAHRRRTPIIMLSGDEVEQAARRAGANEFLRKPGDVAKLVETVARLLARRKGRED
jgi:CheY-like chemotaxis protein